VDAPLEDNFLYAANPFDEPVETPSANKGEDIWCALEGFELPTLGVRMPG